MHAWGKERDIREVMIRRVEMIRCHWCVSTSYLCFQFVCVKLWTHFFIGLSFVLDLWLLHHLNFVLDLWKHEVEVLCCFSTWWIDDVLNILKLWTWFAKQLNGLAKAIAGYSFFLAFEKVTAKDLSRIFKTLIKTGQ